MSGKDCPDSSRLQRGWLSREESVRRHVETCPECRQELLVVAGLGRLARGAMVRKPSSPAVQLWRASTLDRLHFEALTTLPIQVMYFISVVAGLALLLLLADRWQLFAALPHWQGWIPVDLGVGVGGGLLVAALFGLLLAGILSTEEK